MTPNPTGPVSPGPRRGARTGWIVALSLLLIALVAVAGYLLHRGDDAAVSSSLSWAPVEGTSAPGGGTLVALLLQADGAGPGTVDVTGLRDPVPAGRALPWKWAGAAAVPDGTVKMEVRGSGTVSCTISVSGSRVAHDSGAGRARCAISRTAN